MVACRQPSPLQPMLTIASAVHSELLIRKSRFIGCVQPMTDRTEAQKVWAAAGSIDTDLSFHSFLELYRTYVPQC